MARKTIKEMEVEVIGRHEQKRRQKAAYHAEFKPHVKPRSRPWDLRKGKR
jgi:hypothetical protein